MRHTGQMAETAPRMSISDASVVERGARWTIAVNRNQNLLGKTLLVLDRPCESVTELADDEWLDLHRQLRRVCRALDELFQPDLYNHAFLMNQDRHVHLHVVPRYRTPRDWDGESFRDEHWGELFGTEQRQLPDARLANLAAAVRARLIP